MHIKCHLLIIDGNIIKTVKPFVDGTTAKLPAFLKLLKQYLTTLRIQDADEVLLVADGASWIWERIPALLKQPLIPAPLVSFT